MQNGGAEVSMEWILSHMDDADLNDPIAESSGVPEHEAYSANPESVTMLTSMGFTDRQVLPSETLCSAVLHLWQ